MGEALLYHSFHPSSTELPVSAVFRACGLYDLTCGPYHEAVLAKVTLAAGLPVSIYQRHWYRSESMMITCAQTSSSALEAERGWVVGAGCKDISVAVGKHQKYSKIRKGSKRNLPCTKQRRPNPLHHIKLGNRIATTAVHRKAITVFSSHVFCRSSFFGRMPVTFHQAVGWKQQAASTPIEPVPQCSHANWKGNQMYTFVICGTVYFTSRYCL